MVKTNAKLNKTRKRNINRKESTNSLTKTKTETKIQLKHKQHWFLGWVLMCLTLSVLTLSIIHHEGIQNLLERDQRLSNAGIYRPSSFLHLWHCNYPLQPSVNILENHLCSFICAIKPIYTTFWTNIVLNINLKVHLFDLCSRPSAQNGYRRWAA